MSQTVVAEGWREERRGRLLGAAARVFAGHPYEHASMDQIAAEAGVGKPTLYRYFPSKASLFAAVFVEALDDLEQRLEACLDETAAGEAQLLGIIREIVPTFRDHLVSLRMLGETAAAADQSKRRAFRERRARIAGYLEAALARGVEAGAFRPCQTERLAHIMIGAIWSAAGLARNDDEVARDVADMVVHGLAPRRADAAMGAPPAANHSAEEPGPMSSVPPESEICAAR